MGEIIKFIGKIAKMVIPTTRWCHIYIGQFWKKKKKNESEIEKPAMGEILKDY